MKQTLVLLLLAFSLSASSQSISEPVSFTTFDEPCPTKSKMMTAFFINYLQTSPYVAFAINWYAYGDCWIKLFTGYQTAFPNAGMDELLWRMSLDPDVTFEPIQ